MKSKCTKNIHAFNVRTDGVKTSPLNLYTGHEDKRGENEYRVEDPNYKGTYVNVITCECEVMSVRKKYFRYHRYPHGNKIEDC